MIAAFAEWDDMILGQMAFGSCLTIGAAMVKSGLQHEPLGMGEIIDSRIISLGTAAATLSGIDVRMFFVVDFPSYENLSAMRCIVLLASRNLLLSMSLTPRLKLLGMGGAIGSLFGEIVCMIRKIARASFMSNLLSMSLIIGFVITCLRAILCLSVRPRPLTRRKWLETDETQDVYLQLLCSAQTMFRTILPSAIVNTLDGLKEYCATMQAWPLFPFHPAGGPFAGQRTKLPPARTAESRRIDVKNRCAVLTRAKHETPPIVV